MRSCNIVIAALIVGAVFVPTPDAMAIEVPGSSRPMAAVKSLLLLGFAHSMQAMVLKSNNSTDAVPLSLPLSLFESSGTEADMERAFNPTDRDRELATATIMRSMTSDKALRILESHKKVSHSLISSVHTVLRSSSNQSVSRGSLRSSVGDQQNVTRIRNMLNDMIEESKQKYDQEQRRCSVVYETLCAEKVQLSTDQARAQTDWTAAQKEILRARGAKEKTTGQLGEDEKRLAEHNKTCKASLNALNRHLSRIKSDIDIMSTILNMTNCERKPSVPTGSVGLLHCKTECASQAFVSFKDQALRQKVNKLVSSGAHQALHEMFADLEDNSTTRPVLQLTQDGVLQEPEEEEEGKDDMSLSPRKQIAPRTNTPGGDPCGKLAEALDSTVKRSASCKLDGNPSCPDINMKFLFVQAEMLDERDDVKEEINALEDKCDAIKKMLETATAFESDTIATEGTKLAEATGNKAEAEERGGQKNTEYNENAAELKDDRKTCGDNLHKLLQEQCGLVRIRGEVLKKHAELTESQMPEDCHMSPWQKGQCSVTCGEGGGEREITRHMGLPPKNGGVQCPPTTEIVKCNDRKCPVDCQMSEWSGFSKCTAACGEGVQTRTRKIITKGKDGGLQCDLTSETQSCNTASCDVDCVLDAWTEWGECSKGCNWGWAMRKRFVKTEQKGDGKCYKAKSWMRLHMRPCFFKECRKKYRPGKPTLQCMSNVDVILVLDGSFDLGWNGWEKTIEAAKLFVSAFQDNPANSSNPLQGARVAVLTYSGPEVWEGESSVSRCIGESKDKSIPDMEKDCRISWASYFSANVSAISHNLTVRQWPMGGSLTSLALAAAESQLKEAREDVKSVVVVITDGRPLSFRRTGEAAKSIKKVADLIWVPVTRFESLKSIKKWASFPWMDHVFPVDSYNELATPETIDHVIKSVCSKVDGGFPRNPYRWWLG